jgi:hypothetical protein
MAQERRRSGDNSEQDDLFGKLDELIGRHQARAPRRRPEPSVPTLTEAVAPAPQQLEIPVLNEVVEIPSTPSGDTLPERASDSAPPLVDKRKQLQVALYLRLRQRLDQELQAALAANSAGAGSAVDQALARLARELRNALPAIVREAVEQVFAADSEPGESSGKL